MVIHCLYINCFKIDMFVLNLLAYAFHTRPYWLKWNLKNILIVNFFKNKRASKNIDTYLRDHSEHGKSYKVLQLVKLIASFWFLVQNNSVEKRRVTQRRTTQRPFDLFVYCHHSTRRWMHSKLCIAKSSICKQWRCCVLVSGG